MLASIQEPSIQIRLGLPGTRWFSVLAPAYIRLCTEFATIDKKEGFLTEFFLIMPRQT